MTGENRRRGIHKVAALTATTTAAIAKKRTTRLDPNEGFVLTRIDSLVESDISDDRSSRNWIGQTFFGRPSPMTPLNYCIDNDLNARLCDSPTSTAFAIPCAIFRAAFYCSSGFKSVCNRRDWVRPAGGGVS